jgi:hypothetical protein
MRQQYDTLPTAATETEIIISVHSGESLRVLVPTKVRTSARVRAIESSETSIKTGR